MKIVATIIAKNKENYSYTTIITVKIKEIVLCSNSIVDIDFEIHFSFYLNTTYLYIEFFKYSYFIAIN